MGRFLSSHHFDADQNMVCLTGKSVDVDNFISRSTTTTNDRFVVSNDHMKSQSHPPKIIVVSFVAIHLFPNQIKNMLSIFLARCS